MLFALCFVIFAPMVVGFILSTPENPNGGNDPTRWSWH